MTQDPAFDIQDFMPYLLNQAAELSSLEFQQYYKAKYGMLRTEWRVLFHLGRYGDLTAKQICDRARIHKTKVSRAVAALERKRFLSRQQMTQDRRLEALVLTKQGTAAFNDLFNAAEDYDKRIMASFTPQETEVLRKCLAKIAQL